jgi:histidinol-phosphate aminotransferase
MTTTRRNFVKSLGLGGAAAFIGARGHEAWATGLGAGEAPFAAEATTDLILSSNENPLGPGQHVLDAMRGILGPEGAGAGRYHFAQINNTVELLAKKHGVAPENVFIGLGSSQILTVSATVFTSKDRGVVSPDPTFGTCARFAELIGNPATMIPLDGSMYVDLDAMLSESANAGIVYVCNPNNPTGTIQPPAKIENFIASVRRRAPEALILVDEAYHDYVTDPEHESLLSLAAEHPRVIVARTFSKAYGMAGLRFGFAVGHEDTIKKMSDRRGMDMFTNLPGRVGVVAALGNDEHLRQEVARNQGVRDFTRKWFHDAGYEDTESQANFIYIDIRQSNEDFKKACRERGLRIGGGSKLYENHARVTIGTMDEMKRAIEIFAELLPGKTKAVA